MVDPGRGLAAPKARRELSVFEILDDGVSALDLAVIPGPWK